MIKAIKMVGSVIEVDEATFVKILEEKSTGFVVTARAGVFTKKYQYQASLHEFLFFMQTKKPINLHERFTVIVAEKIHNPVLAVS